jgi:hypothetical protein
MKLPTHLGDLMVECPECLDVITVPLKASGSTVVDGTLNVNIEPDLADLWAHVWTHTEAVTP